MASKWSPAEAQARATTRKAGRHGDGKGLYLEVAASGAASWLLRIVGPNGKRRDIGLGSLGKCTIADARARRELAREAIGAGYDPVDVLRAVKDAAARNDGTTAAVIQDARKAIAGGSDPVAALAPKDRVPVPTFKVAAETVHSAYAPGWKNAKHSAQWLTTLKVYAFEGIGDCPVDSITFPMVQDVLLPIWHSKPETARRVLQRIGTVLNWAGATYRFDPPRLDLLSKVLPDQNRIPRHFASMPYRDVPAFVAGLRAKAESIGRLALQFAILTAARSGEVRGATWGEIDLEARLWTIPAERMKAKRQHVVPLSSAAVAILERAALVRNAGGADLLFPGNKDKPMSDMTLLKVMRDGDLRYTPHGFRSSFKVWSGEETHFPDAVSEAALAHGDPDKVRAAYRRTDFLAKRRELMGAWASFVTGEGDAAEVEQADDEEDLIG